MLESWYTFYVVDLMCSCKGGEIRHEEQVKE